MRPARSPRPWAPTAFPMEEGEVAAWAAAFAVLTALTLVAVFA